MPRILIAVDGSQSSLVAVDHGARLASQLGASVVLFHAVAPVTPPTALPVAMVEDLRMALQEVGMTLLERASEHARKHGVPVNTVLDHGEPVHCICAAARAPDVDMVVVGSHGRTGLGHILLGSIAERVVRRCEKPVLVVRAQPAKGA